MHVKQQPSVNLPPKDRFHLAYIIFFILGLGVLFPWNLLINAQSYFSLIFAASNFSEKKSNSFGVSFFVSEVVFMSLITAFQGFSFGMRIQGALALNAVVFVVLAALTFITLDPVLSFQLHIAMVILCGACTAILQNGVFCLVSGNMGLIFTNFRSPSSHLSTYNLLLWVRVLLLSFYQLQWSSRC